MHSRDSVSFSSATLLDLPLSFDLRLTMACSLRKLSKTQKKLWDDLSGRQLVPTKFFDVLTLQRLGLYDCTLRLLVQGGLGGLMDLAAATYKNLVLEFLITFEDKGDRLHFRFFDRDYHLTRADLATIFGVTTPPTDDWRSIEGSQEFFDFWRIVTGVPFDTHSGKYNYKIVHPCLRLCHKVLAMTFLGQGEVNKVSIRDMSMVWCLTPEQGEIPDWVDLFISSVKKARGKRGKIGFGGMITLIALRFMTEDAIRAQCGAFIGDGFVYDFHMLKRVHCLGGSEKRGWVWRTGHPSVDYLRLPKTLVYGSRAHDFFLVSDFESAATGEPVDEEMTDSDRHGGWDAHVTSFQAGPSCAPSDAWGAGPSSSHFPEPPRHSFASTADPAFQELRARQDRLERRLDEQGERMDQLTDMMGQFLASRTRQEQFQQDFMATYLHDQEQYRSYREEDRRERWEMRQYLQDQSFYMQQRAPGYPPWPYYQPPQ